MIFSCTDCHDNEDNAPFQIYLGVQGKQLYPLPEPLLVGESSLQGYLRLLRGSSELHRAYLRPIVLGKESISDFFPVPPAHPQVTKCDIAREKLLGILGDLLDVSLALEESIVPEYLIQQKPRELFLFTFENIYLELIILLVYSGID